MALVVAGGATNAEAAAQLFLSPKTIEYHLSNAYRKLGIRSRAELVRAVLSPRPAAVPEPRCGRVEVLRQVRRGDVRRVAVEDAAGPLQGAGDEP